MTATPQVPAQQLAMLGAPRSLEPLYATDDVVAAAVAYWRARGFPFRRVPLHMAMQEINRLALLADDQLYGTDAGYHLADSYHPHRFAASADRMLAPAEAFEDDALLARAMRLLLADGQRLTPTALASKLAIVSGTQACSNFRPGFALAVYRQFGHNSMAVLDTSAGYGGRLVGWMASGLAGTYTGIDASLAACAGSTRMAADLGFSDRVRLYHSPAEDLDAAQLVADNGGLFDLAFTSPPYFTKERYAAGHSDERLQSWHRYGTADAWRAGFLAPVLHLQAAALRSGGMAVLNVADVRVGGRVYELTEWTLAAAAAAGLVRADVDMRLVLQRRFGANQADGTAAEPLFVFTKP